MRAVKCPKCDKTLDRNTEPYVSHNGRHYHKLCYEQHDKQAQDRHELIDYICELYEIPVPNGYIFKQIKEFTDPPRNYTLKGIELTLRYFHDIKEEPVMKGAGIGIVEYFYNEARNYYINLANIQNGNSKISYDNKEEIVYTLPPKPRKKKMIDIGGI